jgi:2-polyprenyl-6-methoxyphenol hydroxylase-like FAD-dependent oxidoreductase
MSNTVNTTPALPPREVNIVVIGAGTAGTSAASALAQQGLSVALIDAHETHQPDFRAEKIGPQQMDYFEAFGLGPAAYAHMTAFDGVWVHRFGRIIEKKPTREYSSEYPDLVNALRRGLSRDVEVAVGRVDTVETSTDRQHVRLADGRQYSGRLLVVATGLGDAVKRKLGIEREVMSAAHSLSFGFDLANARDAFPFPSLIWTVERPEDQGAYLGLFPIGDKWRGNLFVYRQVNDPWSKQFRIDPSRALHDFLPGFEPLFGRVEIKTPVSARPIDLARSTNYLRPGLVLIGDAFLTVCPITGTGIDKALNDVDVLRRLVPAWLKTPGMEADKIAAFYDDPVKQERDAHALKISWRARSMRMERGLMWTARRLRSAVLVNNAYRMKALLEPFRGRAA